MLARWYHDGLNAFEKHPHGAMEIVEGLADSLELRSTTGGRSSRPVGVTRRSLQPVASTDGQAPHLAARWQAPGPADDG